MEYRRLGNTGLRVSALTLGNWATHGVQIDEPASRVIVQSALDVGVNTFDTSDSYADGMAEEILGRALASERRESLVIATKCFWPTGPGPNERGLSRKHITEACNASLRRLGMDYIDLYQAHRPDPTTPLEETLRALDDLVSQGKVLYVGVSEWEAAEIAEATEIADRRGYVPIASNQPQYSMLWRVIEGSVLPTCRALGVGQIVWSPLAQGVLTGKYLPDEAMPPNSRGTDPTGAGYIGRWMRPAVLEAVARLASIAADCGLSVPQLAMAWVLDTDGVAS
ncbi:MAG: aldo/keto reductase, partial [Limisphaerales bacterium]